MTVVLPVQRSLITSSAESLRIPTYKHLYNVEPCYAAELSAGEQGPPRLATFHGKRPKRGSDSPRSSQARIFRHRAAFAANDE